MKVVLVLLDACRGDYINQKQTPFLFNLSKRSKYYESLVPSFGFCERTEILVGKTALESKCFTAFGFKPKASPYRGYTILLNLLDRIEIYFKSDFVSKVIRRIIWQLFKSKKGTFYPANIPLRELKDFCLTEDGIFNHIENDESSIYNISKKVFKSATTSMDSYLKGTDESRLNSIEVSINEEYDFYPTYVSILDSVGHKYGPDSPEISKALSSLDSRLEKFYKTIVSSNKDVLIVFCGDHGMSSVESSIDFENVIDSFNRDNKIKINYFLDSTLARFWFKGKNEKYKDDLKKKINSLFLGKGFFIERENFELHGIPNSNLYGDLIWVCNDGIVISPDFFNRKEKQIKGMHGYIPSGDMHYGFAIIAGENYEKGILSDPQSLVKIYEDMKKYLVI